MPEVTPEILDILKQKDRMIKSGGQALLGILKELQRQIREELGAAALTSWDVTSLNQLLSGVENAIGQFETAAKARMKTMLDDSWRQGIALVDAPLATAGISTGGFHLATTVLDILKDTAFHRVGGLSNAAWEQIRGELTLGILGGKTPQQVANSIGLNLKSPSIFGSIAGRAEVITKLEMGRVFSQASQLRMDQAARYVPGLEKQWRHAGHPKTARPTHVAADGEHVPVDQPFNIGGVKMMFPRAPGAPLEEVINCGCDHVPYHARWA
jgi:hypothetical protein